MANKESARLKMFLVAKRGRPRKRENPPTDKSGRSGATLNVRIDLKLRERMDEFIAGQRMKPSVTDLVELAMQEFLKAEGWWPDLPKSE